VALAGFAEVDVAEQVTRRTKNGALQVSALIEGLTFQD